MNVVKCSEKLETVYFGQKWVHRLPKFFKFFLDSEHTCWNEIHNDVEKCLPRILCEVSVKHSNNVHVIHLFMNLKFPAFIPLVLD